jgi:hypothetical protein
VVLVHNWNSLLHVREAVDCCRGPRPKIISQPARSGVWLR